MTVKKIRIHNQYIEVSDEKIYDTYKKSNRKMRYFEIDLKTERYALGDDTQSICIIPSREDSLDRLRDENSCQFSTNEESVEDIVLHKLDVDKLYAALSTLSSEEQTLIRALFFEERTERDVAAQLGISQPAVNKRKTKILNKLKLSLES